MARSASFNNRTNPRMLKFNEMLDKLEDLVREATHLQEFGTAAQQGEIDTMVHAARQELRHFVNSL